MIILLKPFFRNQPRSKATSPTTPATCAARHSSMFECSTVIVATIRLSKNTNATFAARVSTIPSISNATSELILVSYHTTTLFSSFFLTKLNDDLGVKPYKCTQCDKSFTQRCSLESHQDKIHGIKPKLAYKQRRDKIYVCEECGFSTGDVRLVLINDNSSRLPCF